MNAPLPLPEVAALPSVPLTSASAQYCENCGNEVSQRYCGACGQRLDPPVHSLVHFSQVAAEDLTHADSRLWRTLGALMFKPGHLTMEFLAGRRARYLPPVRLYLVLSLAFFLFVAAVQPKFAVIKLDAEHPGQSGLILPKAGESTEQRADRLCGDATYTGPWQAQIAPLLVGTCRKVVEDGGRHLSESFLHNVPRAMFVFLPLIAGIMMLLYRHPRRYYVEHLLLLVHNHAFVFLALMLAWIAGLTVHGLPSILKFSLSLYFLWYMYRSMRAAYGQGRVRTWSKLAVLVFSYLVLGGVTLVLTSVYSAVTL